MNDHPLIARVRTSRAPVAALVGFSVEPLGDGQALGWLDAGPQHANPMGTLHGGILCDVADAAMGIAFVTTLGPDESFTTMSLAINFFRPVWETRLRFEARVVNRSKNTGYLECDVTDPEGKLVAKATSTCMVLRGTRQRPADRLWLRGLYLSWDFLQQGAETMGPATLHFDTLCDAPCPIEARNESRRWHRRTGRSVYCFVPPPSFSGVSRVSRRPIYRHSQRS